MSNELHDLLHRGAARPTSDVDVDGLVRTARARRRRRVGVLAAAIVAVIAVIGGAVALAQPSAKVTIASRPAAPPVSVPDGWQEVSIPSEGIGLAIPPEWTRLETYGDEVVTVGSDEFERTGYLGVCGDGRNLQIPPVEGSWLTLVELGASDGGAKLRRITGETLDPSAIIDRPSDFRSVLTDHSACVFDYGTQPAVDQSGRYQSVVFRDHGRVFLARLIALGAVPELDLAARVLDTLTVDEPATPATSAAPSVSTTSTTATTTTRATVPTTPVTTTGDDAEIRAVFLAWLDATERNAMDGIVEDFASIAATHLEGMHQHSDADLAKYSGRVDSVTILDDSHADVRYTVLFDGRPQFSMMPGQAVKIDGKWLVSRDTVCNLLTYGGLHCPPRQ